MREMLATRFRAGNEGAFRRTNEEDRAGEKPTHMAYYLCYPSMVKRTSEEERPGPWEQRF